LSGPSGFSAASVGIGEGRHDTARCGQCARHDRRCGGGRVVARRRHHLMSASEGIFEWPLVARMRPCLLTVGSLMTGLCRSFVHVVGSNGVWPEAEWRFRKQRSRKAAVRTGSIGPTYFVPFRTFRSGRVSPRAAIPTGSMVGFVSIQDTRPSTALLAFDIGSSSSAGQCAAACGEPIRPGGRHRRSPESGRSRMSVASGRDSPRQSPARRRHAPQVGVELRKHRATPAPPPASHAKAVS
jgi:hypothetical protein